MSLDAARFLTRPLTPRELLVLDLLFVAGYLLVLVTTLASRTSDPVMGEQLPGWTNAIIVLSMALPLLFRRRWPVRIFGVVLGATLVGFASGVVGDAFVGAGIALYAVALGDRGMTPRATLLIAGLAVVGAVFVVAAGSPIPRVADAGPILVGLVVLAGAWTIGRAVRERRRYAERAASQLVELAVTDERLRIARDLHDVAAHGLSLIVVKAATANHVMGVRPDEARDALEVIETTGRDALAEMRQMLDVLRSDDPSGQASLSPSPTLDQLSSLAEAVASAGVQVDLSMVGAEELPDGVALSVYRIVQEALTNVVKHAAPARCDVQITAADRVVEINIVDDGAQVGRSEPYQGSGHGLMGMRERARLHGGELDAGPLPGRGFRVVARLPYGAPSRTALT